MRHLIVVDPPNAAMIEAPCRFLLIRDRLAAANAAGAVELQDVPGVVEAVRRIVARHYHPNAQTLIAMETADLLAAIGAALKGEAGNA